MELEGETVTGIAGSQAAAQGRGAHLSIGPPVSATCRWWTTLRSPASASAKLGATRAARRGVEGCRRLRDRLAIAARELLAHRLDHLPLPRNHLQRLGDILAQLRQLLRPTAGTARGRRDHDALAWQVLGERLARRPLAPEGLYGLRLGLPPSRRRAHLRWLFASSSSS